VRFNHPVWRRHKAASSATTAFRRRAGRITRRYTAELMDAIGPSAMSLRPMSANAQTIGLDHGHYSMQRAIATTP